MSKLAANFGGGNKNTVYHFLRELILEEEYAWFVNQEGRFRINWVAAVERHIEYRAKKNPGFDTSIDRSRASNSFREALLLRCYRDDGAKEYKECRKFSENNKVVEREFQLPSRVFHSLFGSSEELAGDQADGDLQVSPDVGTSPDASDTGFEELMDVSDDLHTMNATSTALQENINREDNVDPSNIESPSQIFGISTKDFHSALEEISTDSDNVVQQPGVVQGICPLSGSVKGGIQFLVVLKEALLESDTKGVARFERVGDASLEKTSPHTFSGFIPAAQEAGRVLVTVYTEAGQQLGVTYFTYVDEVCQALKQLIKDPAQISLFLTMWSQEHGIIGSSSDVAQTPGSLPDAKQVQSLKILQLLVYTAAQEGAQQFLEVIFSTSAGKIVFNSYKDRTPLPEDVARANGHDKLVEFLQDVNKRLSKESDSNSVTLSTSEWLELVQAVGNVQKQTVSNDEQESSRIQPKDDDNQSDYFADAETSSCGSHDLVGYWSDLQVENEHRLADVDTSSCGSFEVDSDRSDSEGSFTKDIKPTEKESPSLNPPVELSSKETTQFDQAEDEEKTSFGFSRFHMFNPLNRRVGGPGSNDTHHCVLSWGTFLMCAVILLRLLAGFIVKGFLFFIGVVMGLLKKSRLVCAHVCLAFGGTLICSTNSLRFTIFGFPSSIECKRYLMVYTNWLVVTGILPVCLTTIVGFVGSILYGFQSFTDVVELLTASVFFGLNTAVTLLFCVAVTLLLFDFHISIMRERYLMVSTHCILAVVGILMYFMMTKRSNLVGFQSFTGAVEPLTVSLFFGLTAALTLLFCVAMTLLLLDARRNFPVTAQRQEKIEKKIKEDSSIFFLEEENRLFYPPGPYTSMNNFFILDRDNKEELRGKVRG